MGAAIRTEGSDPAGSTDKGSATTLAFAVLDWRGHRPTRIEHATALCGAASTAVARHKPMTAPAALSPHEEACGWASGGCRPTGHGAVLGAPQSSLARFELGPAGHADAPTQPDGIMTIKVTFL